MILNSSPGAEYKGRSQIGVAVAPGVELLTHKARQHRPGAGRVDIDGKGFLGTEDIERKFKRPPTDDQSRGGSRVTVRCADVAGQRRRRGDRARIVDIAQPVAERAAGAFSKTAQNTHPFSAQIGTDHGQHVAPARTPG